MEDYLKIDWSRNTRRSEAEFLNIFDTAFVNNEDDVFYHHLNEIDPIHRLPENADTFLFNNTLPVDPRTKKEIKNVVIHVGHNLKIFQNFPSGSSLTMHEHQMTLRVMEFLHHKTMDNFSEMELAQYQLYSRLTERITAEKAQFNVFVKNYYLSNLLYRKRSINKELDDLVIKMWKKKVSKMKIDSRNYQILTALSLCNEHTSEVTLTMEKMLKQFGRVKDMDLKILLNTMTINRNTRMLDQFVADYNKTKHKTDLQEMINDAGIDVVIPAGVFYLLMDYFGNTKSVWYIPFLVTTILDKKVIIIDNKLPHVKLNTVEREYLACKYLIRTFSQAETQQTDPEVNEHSKYEKEYKVHTTEDYMKMLEKGRTRKDTPAADNATYRHWKLKDGDEQAINLLIKSRQDYCSTNDGSIRNLNISIKVEYQSDFGAEIMTDSELIKEWCRQKLRPDSQTLRLRIDAKTKAIISHKYVCLADIEKDLQRLHNIKPMQLLSSFGCILKLLKNMPTGSFLMRHELKNEQNVMIYKCCDGQGTNPFSPNTIYQNIEYNRSTLEEFTWTPLDDMEVTKLHKDLTLIPCTFPHWVKKKKLVKREQHFKNKKEIQVVKKPKKKKSKRKQRRKAAKPQSQDDLDVANSTIPSQFIPKKVESSNQVDFSKCDQQINYQEYVKEAMKF